MLDHLQRRIVETLAEAHSVTLATYGPASIQAHVFPCEAQSGALYILVPRTSDHLFNIENHPSVVATTSVGRCTARPRRCRCVRPGWRWGGGPMEPGAPWCA